MKEIKRNIKDGKMTGILLIATHKYRQFVPQMLESLKHLKFPHEVVLFTDAPEQFPEIKHLYKIKHYPFPYPSLYRFKYFLSADLSMFDHVFYVDVDARFVADVEYDEINSDLVAVEHCGFYFHPERIQQANKESFFANFRFRKYYGGGFIGGKTKTFVKACEWLDHYIDSDLDKGILPIHNDETAWNAYLSINPPTLELTPSFHYPQDIENFKQRCWDGRDFEPKLLLLKKNHAEIRS